MSTDFIAFEQGTVVGAFEQGMVVGTRCTCLCQELQQCCFFFQTQQFPVCIQNGPPPKGHPANLTTTQYYEPCSQCFVHSMYLHVTSETVTDCLLSRSCHRSPHDSSTERSEVRGNTYTLHVGNSMMTAVN